MLFTSGVCFNCRKDFDTLCNEILYSICFDLYTVSMTLYDANKFNLTVTQVLYMWTLFLLLKTFLHEWSRLISSVTNYFIVLALACITSLWFFLMQRNAISEPLKLFTSGLYFIPEQVLIRVVTPSNSV
jgi:hypothetical protein